MLPLTDKIAINLYLISSVSLTNSLANISKKIGADWSDIQQSLRKDKRIGKHAYSWHRSWRKFRKRS